MGRHTMSCQFSCSRKRALGGYIVIFTSLQPTLSSVRGGDSQPSTRLEGLCSSSILLGSTFTLCLEGYYLVSFLRSPLPTHRSRGLDGMNVSTMLGRCHICLITLCKSLLQNDASHHSIDGTGSLVGEFRIPRRNTPKLRFGSLVDWHPTPPAGQIKQSPNLVRVSLHRRRRGSRTPCPSFPIPACPEKEDAPRNAHVCRMPCPELPVSLLATTASRPRQPGQQGDADTGATPCVLILAAGASKNRPEIPYSPSLSYASTSLRTQK